MNFLDTKKLKKLIWNSLISNPVIPNFEAPVVIGWCFFVFKNIKLQENENCEYVHPDWLFGIYSF